MTLNCIQEEWEDRVWARSPHLTPTIVLNSSNTSTCSWRKSRTTVNGGYRIAGSKSVTLNLVPVLRWRRNMGPPLQYIGPVNYKMSSWH